MTAILQYKTPTDSESLKRAFGQTAMRYYIARTIADRFWGDMPSRFHTRLARVIEEARGDADLIINTASRAGVQVGIQETVLRVIKTRAETIAHVVVKGETERAMELIHAAFTDLQLGQPAADVLEAFKYAVPATELPKAA